MGGPFRQEELGMCLNGEVLLEWRAFQMLIESTFPSMYFLLGPFCLVAVSRAGRIGSFLARSV